MEVELEKKQKEVEGIESGLIRIGTISSGSCHWLPSLMYKCKKIYPNVTFELFQGEYTNISDGVMNGTIDFGFVNPHATTNLHSILLTQDEMHVILPQNHPLAKNEYIDLKTIQAEPFILLNEGDYNEVLDIFHSQGLSPNIQYNVHDDYTIMAMVEQGLGISILSNLVLTRCPYDIIKKSLSPYILLRYESQSAGAGKM